MANYRHGATYGSLAYDLDALAREKQLDEAGKLPQKKVRPAQPEVQPVQRRQSAARAAVRPSPVLLLGTVLVVGMVIALMLCYVKLTGISDNVSSIKREISALEEEHVALLTAYERTFDLATVKAAAEAAGMSKPAAADTVHRPVRCGQRGGVRRGRRGGAERLYRKGRVAVGVCTGIFPLRESIV